MAALRRFVLCHAELQVYTYVGKSDRKTQPIRACDIDFHNGAHVLSHNDPLLHLAETVSINFDDQKSDIKDKTVSHNSNDRKGLNPVCMCAKTIQRLRFYPGFTDEWEIYTYFNGKPSPRYLQKKMLRHQKFGRPNRIQQARLHKQQG